MFRTPDSDNLGAPLANPVAPCGLDDDFLVRGGKVELRSDGRGGEAEVEAVAREAALQVETLAV